VSIKETAERMAKIAQERAEAQAAYDEELDGYIGAIKREGGPELTRNEMHRILFFERQAQATKAAVDRESEALSILRKLPARSSRNEPSWLGWKNWSRDDFIRAVTWDQAHGGRGGKTAIAHRCLAAPSAVYRGWQAVAPGEPWPAGNKGPSGP
jgi:hypothetical protein